MLDFSSLEKLHEAVAEVTDKAALDEQFKIPSLLQFRRSLMLTHLKRHFATEAALTGKTDYNTALKMVEEGLALPGPIPPIPAPGAAKVGAASGQFANIVNWITNWINNDLPQLLQTFVKLAPVILQLISLFSATGA